MPSHLSDALLHALISIEFEMIEHGVEPSSGPDTDPFADLMVRAIAEQVET